MSKWTASNIPAQSGRTALVTGANSGLGFDTALELARHGARVVLACRSKDKTEAAMAAIRAQVPEAQLEFLPLDLSDLASVRAAAAGFTARNQKLDLLINNAGIMAVPLARTRDGFEMQMGTNHLGHFAFAGPLLPLLQATPGARVVSLASLAHRWTRRMSLDDLNYEKDSWYNKWDAYSKSKLANLLFTFELDRRLKAAGIPVTAVAAHPGYSATNLSNAEIARSAVMGFILNAGNKIVAQPAHMGALPTLYAATSPDVQSADYIGPDGFNQVRGYPKKVGCRELARDPALAAGLWALSEKLTGVSYLSA